MEKMPPDPETMIYGSHLPEPQSQELSAVEKLMMLFEGHEDQEGEFLQCYKEIAEKSTDPLTKYLLQLIISDEEKHRAVTHAIVSTLRGGLTWTRPEDALHGFGKLGEGKENQELLRVTEDFIQHEKEGIKAYKQLIKSSKGYYAGLFVLLLQSMIHDSEKHVEILEFLRRRSKEA